MDTSSNTSKPYRVAIYARQSSGKDEKRSESIQSQVKRLTAYVQQNNWTLVESPFTDADISGRTYPDLPEAHIFAERDTAYQLAMENKEPNKRLRKGLASLISSFDRIDCVLLTDDERLMRPAAMSHLESYMMQTFTGAGIYVCLIGEQPKTYNDFNKRLITRLSYEVGGEKVNESANKGQIALAEFKANAEVWHGSFAGLFGYSKTEQKRVYRVNEQQATIVRKLFSDYTSGVPMGAILRELNSSTIHKKRWYLFTVKSMLRNPAYIGCDKQNGILRNLKGLPAIVEPATWHKAQDRLKQATNRHTKSKTYVHPLAGLVFCGVCGQHMAARQEKQLKTSRVYQVYTCPNSIQGSKPEHRERCREIRLPENTWQASSYYRTGLLQAVIPFVVHGAVSDYLENLADTTTEDKLKQTQDELAALDQQFTELGRELANGDKKPVNVIRIMAPMEQRQAELEKQLRELQQKQNAQLSSIDPDNFNWQHWFDCCNSVIDVGTLKEYQILARQIIGRLTVYPDKFTIETKAGISVSLPIERVRNYRTLPVCIAEIIAMPGIPGQQVHEVRCTYVCKAAHKDIKLWSGRLMGPDTTTSLKTGGSVWSETVIHDGGRFYLTMIGQASQPDTTEALVDRRTRLPEAVTTAGSWHVRMPRDGEQQ